MSRYNLQWYDLQELKNDSWRLTIPLFEFYKGILSLNFPNLFENSWLPGSKTSGSIIIKPKEKTEIEKLQRFLNLLKEAILLQINDNLKRSFITELDFCLALDYHLEDSKTRSDLGAMVYGAKYRHDQESAKVLADSLTEALRTMPAFMKSDFIASMPGNPSKQYHLPDLLVNGMEKRLGMVKRLIIRKIRDTPQVKNMKLEDKLISLENVFEIDHSIKGKSVLIVDDLYQSGASMWNIARFLKKSGARMVYGLACVKTWRDTDNM
jgi:hypothetical protein